MGAILWGTVISLAGFLTFFTLHFKWENNFDWWLLVLFAFVPQIFISIREKREKVVKTQTGLVLDIVWIIFGLSIFAVIFYMHKSPQMYMKFFVEDGMTLLSKNIATGEIKDYWLTIVPSPGSLLLLLFAMPTIITGVVQKFWPMIIGAIITYLFFIISIYTRNPIDQLMMGVAGLVNWLIPGLILRKNYLKARNKAHV
jgi:hypothetical protein